MKKIIITLSITILVFVMTLFITNRYITSKSIETADTMVDQKMEAFRADFDVDLQMTRNVVYSFLSANLLGKTAGDSDCLYVNDNGMEFFGKHLQEHLSSFLKVNPYYFSAMFIIEKDSRQPLTKDSYYAPIISVENPTLHDLAKMQDISQSNSIKKCKESRKAMWSLPSERSGVRKKLVTYYVPIFRDSDNSFFGAFVLSINIATIDSELEIYLPYKNHGSEIFLISETNDIISSYPTIYRGSPSHALLDNSHNKSRVIINDSTKQRKVLEYDKKEYFLYERTLKNSPWKIVIACNSNAVYSDAYRMRNVIYITSLIGMLLMLVSCVVIMIQIYHTNREKVEAEKELNMASKVQMSMLRKKDHENATSSLSAFIQPAREAGGDLYDYVEVDGKLVFCVGDVSGKGMSAALFMTQIVSLFRSATKRSTDPSVIVSSINEVLSDNNPDMTFCTLFVGTLEGNNLLFCNAGHNAPLGIPANDSDTPSFLPMMSNIAIGIMRGFQYSTETYALHQGDAIMFYTDGVTEAKNKSHQLYGEERIISSLVSRKGNAPDYCNRLVISSVRDFVKGAVQSDDITLVTIVLQ